MSQRRNNRSRHQSSDDDSDGEEFSPTQSQSQCLTSKEIQKLAGQVCNLLLVGEMKKIPIKSADIKKSIILKKHRSSYQTVMDKAGEIMEHVFGYKIVALKGNSYILVNTMGGSLVKHQQLSNSEQTEQGLLIVILIAIFMSEGKISQGALDSYLSVLDVDLTATAKPMIQDFIRKKYLQTTTEDSSDPPTLMYHWGERSHAEFSKKDILEFACKVYGNNMKPSIWTYQWKLVKGDTKEEEEAATS